MKIDQLEMRANQLFMAQVAARAAGAEIEVSDPSEAREQFDEMLREPIGRSNMSPEDLAYREILASLGMRR